MVGEDGTFAFSSAARDVVRYRYDITNDEHGPAFVDAEPAGTAAVRFMPSRRTTSRSRLRARRPAHGALLTRSAPARRLMPMVTIRPPPAPESCSVWTDRGPAPRLSSTAPPAPTSPRQPVRLWIPARGSRRPPGYGWHLAAVYDPANRELRLYVNGELAGSGTRGSSWNATGPVQIGRGRDDGQYRGHWHGQLAEVHVFDRVVFQDEIASLSELAVERAGYWQLNEAPAGESPELDGGQPLVLSGAGIYQPVDPIFDPLLAGGERVGAGTQP